jgi:hypothetical protein
MCLDAALGDPFGEADRAAIPSAAGEHRADPRVALSLPERAWRDRCEPSQRRARNTERPYKPSPCLEKAGRKARLFLKTHRTSLQRGRGSRNRVSVVNPATRSRGPRGAVRPARRSTTKTSRGGPDGELAGEGPPHGGRRSPPRHAPRRRAAAKFDESFPRAGARPVRGHTAAVRRRRDEGSSTPTCGQPQAECLSISEPRARSAAVPSSFPSNDRSRLCGAASNKD